MTTNLEAYNLYLQGRHFWNGRGKDNLLRSVDSFEKALALDPKYAPAYAGLADAYAILGNNLFFPPGKAYPKAREFAERALEIDNELADSISALALIWSDYDWDLVRAERDYKRAIELDPGNARVHQKYAFALACLGRLDEAIREINRARDLDPLALRIRGNIGHILYLVG